MTPTQDTAATEWFDDKNFYGPFDMPILSPFKSAATLIGYICFLFV